MEYTEQQWADMRRWVNQWKETGPILEQMRADELAAMSEDESQRSVHEVLKMGDLWREQNPEYKRPGSGLVEQQEIFSRWKTLSS